MCNQVIALMRYRVDLSVQKSDVRMIVSRVGGRTVGFEEEGRGVEGI